MARRPLDEEFEALPPEHRRHFKRVADAVTAWLSDRRHKSSLLIDVPVEAAHLMTTMCDMLFSHGLNAYFEDDTHLRVVEACVCVMKPLRR